MKRILGMAIVGALAGPSLALAASSTNSTIVIGQRIGPVKLGATEAQVKRMVGKPSLCSPCTGKNADWSYLNKKFYGRISFDAQGRVNDVYSNQPRYRTRKGIHPWGGGKVKGSSLAAVEKAYRRVKCPKPIPPAAAGPFPCTVISSFHGHQTTTAFNFYPPVTNGVGEIEISWKS